ncbi:MAG: sugar phosphate isomerase/epimerase [Chthonomonadales bacterium]
MTFSRRDFLTAAAGSALAVAGSNALALPVFDGDYGPFRMGMQSYTLRAFSFERAIELTSKFGLHYWESYQAHIGLTEDKTKIAAIRATLKSNKIRLMGWGVQAFDADVKKSRKIFDFAKAMHVGTITADPAPEAFSSLEKLCAEYKINIAIHNHGPGARYDKISSVEAAVKGRNNYIGVCVDTGHYLRSSEDPVEAIKRFGKRVHSVHLKDVKGTTQFTEVGLGELRVVALFRELKLLHYKNIVALEYEEHAEDPVKYIDTCLTATRDAISKATA